MAEGVVGGGATKPIEKSDVESLLASLDVSVEGIVSVDDIVQELNVSRLSDASDSSSGLSSFEQESRDDDGVVQSDTDMTDIRIENSRLRTACERLSRQVQQQQSRAQRFARRVWELESTIKSSSAVDWYGVLRNASSGKLAITSVAAQKWERDGDKLSTLQWVKLCIYASSAQARQARARVEEQLNEERTQSAKVQKEQATLISRLERDKLRMTEKMREAEEEIAKLKAELVHIQEHTSEWRKKAVRCDLAETRADAEAKAASDARKTACTASEARDVAVEALEDLRAASRAEGQSARLLAQDKAYLVSETKALSQQVARMEQKRDLSGSDIDDNDAYARIRKNADANGPFVRFLRSQAEDNRVDAERRIHSEIQSLKERNSELLDAMRDRQGSLSDRQMRMLMVDKDRAEAKVSALELELASLRSSLDDMRASEPILATTHRDQLSIAQEKLRAESAEVRELSRGLARKTDAFDASSFELRTLQDALRVVKDELETARRSAAAREAALERDLSSIRAQRERAARAHKEAVAHARIVSGRGTGTSDDDNDDDNDYDAWPSECPALVRARSEIATMREVQRALKMDSSQSYLVAALEERDDRISRLASSLYDSEQNCAAIRETKARLANDSRALRTELSEVLQRRASVMTEVEETVARLRLETEQARRTVVKDAEARATAAAAAAAASLQISDRKVAIVPTGATKVEAHRRNDTKIGGVVDGSERDRATREAVSSSRSVVAVDHDDLPNSVVSSSKTGGKRSSSVTAFVEQRKGWDGTPFPAWYRCLRSKERPS
eukprot:g667.t1